MARYLVERTFLDEVTLPGSGRGAVADELFAEQNARHGVIWMTSFVAGQGRKTFCLVEAPSPAAIRQAALQIGLPVDRITAVSILDPYSFKPGADDGPPEAGATGPTGEQNHAPLD